MLPSQYGKLVNYSGQGVEKINDDIQKIQQSKTNNYDATIDALKVRKGIEYLKTDGCERIKRDYICFEIFYYNHVLFVHNHLF
jgi:hypothetical protein